MSNAEDRIYLTPTNIIDSDHPNIVEYAEKTARDASGQIEKAVKLYLAVRDGIRYDPYLPFHKPEHYRASKILENGRGFCVPKASLLCALGRATGIPSRVGFATVRNHLATRQLIESMGSNLFVYHAFVEFHLEGEWVKATPAFNKELCERHNVPPLEFTGREDSLFQPYNGNNEQFMEYVAYQGVYADIPLAEILEAWKETYGAERVRGWIDAAERDGTSRSNFEQEEVWNG
jgi:transglutaminase-like putative cysteine protease